MCHFQRSIHLVGADMVETLALVFFRQTLPVELCRLKEGEGSHDIRLRKSERVFDTTIDMALGGQVDDTRNMVVLHEFQDAFEVADVHPDELIVRTMFHILQVLQVAGVRQLVKTNNPVFGVFVYEKTYHMASDKACAASDNNALHKLRVES